MSFYTIKDLERLSNQKAHTIRIWEQRYGLLHPDRTDTNIRYYDDAQLKKLLNVCMLLNSGMKISNIGKLSEEGIRDEINKIIQTSYQPDAQIEGIVSQALIAIATYDEISFNELFADSVAAFGLNTTYIRIIYPLLVRTGLMWMKDDLLPAQEHFLSNLVRQKLFAAIDAIPAPKSPDQTWVLFLGEQEDHEIGLLFANYLLRAKGKKVLYLGARVPYQDLFDVIQHNKPSHIYTFFVKNQSETEMGTLIGQLKTDFPAPALCVSGANDRLQKIADITDVYRISSIEALLAIINTENVI
jgi:DNA-binding transcriptional MerR regulator/methylmalonyl-CoA mutase cobalamin-binding subunit